MHEEQRVRRNWMHDHIAICRHYAMRLALVLSTTILVTAMLTEETSIVAPPKTRSVPPDAIMARPRAAWAIFRFFMAPRPSFRRSFVPV